MKKKRGTLALVSLGCAKNAVDLQVMTGNLLKEGWTLSPDPDCADVVISDLVFAFIHHFAKECVVF